MTVSRPPRRGLLPLTLTLVFVLLGTAVIVRDDLRQWWAGGAVEPPAYCASSTPVTVAASTEKAALLEQMAQRYNGLPGSCADVAVTPVNSGDGAAGLANGWNSSALGPEPDVWSPSASVWVGVARQGPVGADVVPEAGGPSLVTSPLVFAVPMSAARALGWPNTSLSWEVLAELTGSAEARRARGLPAEAFPLGKTNPTVATSGLHALLGALQTVAPGQGLPGGRTLEQRVADPAALAFERRIEAGVIHYGNTQQEFLTNLAAAARTGSALDYAGAVAVEEKSVVDYNLGNASGDFPVPLGAPRPAEPLAAVPIRDGTYVSDNPFVVLDAPWVDDAVRAAAEDFRRWLTEPPQQREFQAAGFRDADGLAGPGMDRSLGIPPQPVIALPVPSGEAVAQALAAWPSLRKQANVVVVMDRSGSMRTAVSEEDPTSRWDATKQAAIEALGRLGPADTLSLRTFSSAAGGGPPYRVDVPPGPVAQTLPRVDAALRGITPSGGTALYESTRDAVAAVRAGYDPSRINAVILVTDGRNEDTAVLDPGPLFADLDQGPGRPPVRVFSMAIAPESDFETLRRMGEISGGYAYDARDPRTIDDVFDDLIANF